MKVAFDLPPRQQRRRRPKARTHPPVGEEDARPQADHRPNRTRPNPHARTGRFCVEMLRESGGRSPAATLRTSAGDSTRETPIRSTKPQPWFVYRLAQPAANAVAWVIEGRSRLAPK